MSKKYWIKDALSNNKGALRRTAMRKGLLRDSDDKLSITDLHKLEKMGGKTAKRAYLAETLRKFEHGGNTHWDAEYRDGGSITSDRRFTEWDFNKLMASDKFEAVWSGYLWNIKEKDRTRILGKFNPKTNSLYISGEKNMNNFLVVWMTENGFVNSNEYAILKNGGAIESLEKELRKLQRDLNSERLRTYREGDNSEEEIARQKEREVKLARFNEVLSLLREKDKYAKGGGVELTKQKCFAFWNNEMAKDKNVYWDNQSYELNTTLMSEDAQHHFGVATDMGQTDIEKDIEDWAFEYVYDWEQKNKKYAYGGEIGDGFLISEMRNYLNKKFPDSFGFVVNTPESNTRAGFDLTPSQKEPYKGLSDSDIKSKLYFPQYKRDHEINYKIYQGSENTYFYFYLNDENGNPYIGQFGFKDDGDVDSTYITRFIAFLMEQYGLPFSVSHDVYAKGGGIKDKKGDIGKHTGKQYGYTLSEVEKAWKNILVSPTDYWKKEEGSVYTDSFGRRQVVRESSKSSIMTGYAYRIMILLDLGSNKVPASAKKYSMSIYEFAPNEISVKSYKNGGNIPYESFNYRLLDRLRSDNDYYLRHPHEKHLWAGSVDEQIKEMKRLWNNFPKDAKPEWLSMEDILEYERKMKNVSKYSNGGGIERIDLFEDYENIPTNIQEILDEYSQDFEDGNYDGLAKALEEVQAEGYTFEYYLDGKAYGLRPIDVPLNELKGYEEFANGGGIEEDYSDLKFASKQFSKTAEMLVKENLNNGEICMCKLTKILGHEPNYPVQIVGSLKLEKCFMKRFYKIA